MTIILCIWLTCTVRTIEQYPLDRPNFTEVQIVAHKEWKF